MIRLEKKEACCGCAACVQVCPAGCIAMVRDEEGAPYPVADAAKCLECGFCEEVCPFREEAAPRKPRQVYAVKNQAGDVRLHSSSGGVFTLLATQVIDAGGVVFGAAFDENYRVVHTCAVTKQELDKLRGAKYVQSDTAGVYEAAESYLKKGREVLFAGTPCQVSALRRYLKKEYEKLVTVDFICHGVPAPGIWEMYLREVSHKAGAFSPAAIAAIRFRDKFYGWKKFCLALYVKKKEAVYPFRLPLHLNAYLRGFLHDLYLRPSCYSCRVKGLRSGSDITLGDYWGIAKTHPELDDDRGVSAVLLNTGKGAARFNWDTCCRVETDYPHILKTNGALEKSPAVPPGRELFYARYAREGVIATVRNLTGMTFKERLKAYLLLAYYRINKLLNRTP
ncbi:MAG: Coenzyme F420 hydrogenase/dehydrogenase, beta subunit C-terminal domain [Parabacteroides sp.]|nr:Coenzyme F420 hydrogenase/dehydrogenase, beta subunit C-terminal domain [Parabacteroides sp.]